MSSTVTFSHRTRIDAQRLRWLLTALARKHRVPAAQLAVHVDGQTVAVAAGGVDDDAKFPVGSITKAFTATLAMLLVADGDLDLDDPIGDYLGDLGPKVGRLTVRQVLSHTGGLPASLGNSTRRYVRDCGNADFVQSPGHGFSYSNVGYVLIGHVVAEITGMDWWEAVESLLLRPLGIEPTFVARPKSVFVPGHAVNAETGAVRAVEQTLHHTEAAAGALALSARDMVGFGLMHVTDTAPLCPDLLHQMRRPLPGAVPFGLADGWGLGLALFRGADADWVGHDGTADGTSCHLRIDPAHGRIVALTTNAGSGAALWVDLVGELRALGVSVGDYDLPRDPEPVNPPPSHVSGSYANGDMEYTVEAPADGPALLWVGGEAYPDLAVHDDWAFSVREPASGRRIIGGRFLTDPFTGRISGIQAGGRVACRRPKTAGGNR